MRLTAATTAAIVAASSSAAAVVAVAPMAGDEMWPAAPQPTPWYSYPLPPHFPNDAGAFGSALAASRPRLWVLASEGESLGDVRVRLNTTLLRSPKLAAMAADMRRSAWQLAWCHRHAAAANCSNLLPALHSTKGVNQGAQTQDRIGVLAWVAVLDPDAEFSAELPRAAYVARALADLAAASLPHFCNGHEGLLTAARSPLTVSGCMALFAAASMGGYNDTQADGPVHRQRRDHVRHRTRLRSLPRGFHASAA